jgi:hypothetical protein
MSVSSLNFCSDGGGFALLVQYDDREVQLTLPLPTTFQQLHQLLSQHWPSAAVNTLIQDGPNRERSAVDYGGWARLGHAALLSRRSATALLSLCPLDCHAAAYPPVTLLCPRRRRHDFS